MKIDLNINEKNGVITVASMDDNIVLNKQINLDEFIKKYTSMTKENEERNESIYLPAGTFHYVKNLNSNRYFIQTMGYKSYYNVEDIDTNIVLVVDTNLTSTIVRNIKVFTCKGPINKSLSRFTSICSLKPSDSNMGVDEEIKVAVEKSKKAVIENTTSVSQLKYSELLDV